MLGVRLTEDKIRLISVEYRRRRRDVLTAYILCALFWFGGIHKFYLLRPIEGIFYVFSVFCGTGSILWGLFSFEPVSPNIVKLGLGLLILTFAFLVYDFLTLWRQVEKTNEKIYAEIFEKITGVPYRG